jgi:hypothetical protein
MKRNMKIKFEPFPIVEHNGAKYRDMGNGEYMTLDCWDKMLSDLRSECEMDAELICKMYGVPVELIEKRPTIEYKDGEVTINMVYVEDKDCYLQ